MHCETRAEAGVCAAEAETFASPVSLAPVSPPRLDADEAAPTFASSIPEKCCSANRGCGGTTPGGFQALRPMDSCGTLSSLIGSKAVPRQAATLSASVRRTPRPTISSCHK